MALEKEYALIQMESFFNFFRYKNLYTVFIKNLRKKIGNA